MSPIDGPDRASIEAALLAYQLMPGRYALKLREPAVLFAAIPQVLQIAAGRYAAEGKALPTSPSRPGERCAQQGLGKIPARMRGPCSKHRGTVPLEAWEGRHQRTRGWDQSNTIQKVRRGPIGALTGVARGKASSAP